MSVTFQDEPIKSREITLEEVIQFAEENGFELDTIGNGTIVVVDNNGKIIAIVRQ